MRISLCHLNQQRQQQQPLPHLLRIARGKSSVADVVFFPIERWVDESARAHVFDPLQRLLAPVVVPIAADDDERRDEDRENHERPHRHRDAEPPLFVPRRVAGSAQRVGRDQVLGRTEYHCDSGLGGKGK